MQLLTTRSGWANKGWLDKCIKGFKIRTKYRVDACNEHRCELRPVGVKQLHLAMPIPPAVCGRSSVCHRALRQLLLAQCSHENSRIHLHQSNFPSKCHQLSSTLTHPASRTWGIIYNWMKLIGAIQLNWLWLLEAILYCIVDLLSTRMQTFHLICSISNSITLYNARLTSMGQFCITSSTTPEIGCIKSGFANCKSKT